MLTLNVSVTSSLTTYLVVLVNSGIWLCLGTWLKLGKDHSVGLIEKKPAASSF